MRVRLKAPAFLLLFLLVLSLLPLAQPAQPVRAEEQEQMEEEQEQVEWMEEEQEAFFQPAATSAATVWRDTSFEPKLLENYPSKGYLTWNTSFGLYVMDKLPYVMSVRDRDGVLRVAKSMFWLNTSDTGKALNTDKIGNRFQILVQNNVYFTVKYAVTTDKEVVGWLTVTYEFFKDAPPKISVKYENLKLTTYNIVWVILPTLKYLESKAGVVDYTVKTATDFIDAPTAKESKYCRVGETSLSTDWMGWLLVCWSDVDGASALYAGVEKVFGSKGLTIVFPQNVDFIDPTVVFATVSVTSVATCPLGPSSFVVAYHDETNDRFCFKIYSVNGTLLLGETVVDPTSGGSIGYTSVSVSAFNSTHFVIGWFDRAEEDVTFAVYDRWGARTIVPIDVDTAAGSSLAVSVSTLSDTRFVIAWYDWIDWDIRFHVRSSTGAFVAEGVADTSVEYSFTAATCAFNSTHFVVAWLDREDGDVTFSIYRIVGATLTLIAGPVDVDYFWGGTYGISVSTLNSTHFVIGWGDGTDRDVTFAVYRSTGSLAVGPIDADTEAGTIICSVRTAALNSTHFAITWYDESSEHDLSFAIYRSSGAVVKGITDIESWPTSANTPFRFQCPCSQETASDVRIHGGNWVIAYANTTSQAVWRTYKPDGSEWDGKLSVAPGIGGFTAPPTVYAGVFFRLNATINDPNGVRDFVNATVAMSHGVILHWVNATNTFSLHANPHGYCTLDAAGSTRTFLNATAARLSWRIRLHWHYPEGSVSILAAGTRVFDVDGLSGSGSMAGAFTFEDDLAVVSASVDDDRVNPGDTVTFTGTVAYEGSTLPPGAGSSAMSFDGVDDYVSVPHSPSTDLKTALTLAAWVYRTRAALEWVICKNYETSPDTQYGFHISSTHAIVFILNGANRVFFTLNTMGRWAFIVCTWDGSVARIFVDGTLRASASYSDTLITRPYALTLGCRKTTGGVPGAFWLQGLLDEVRVYNRSLSAAEVADLYGGRDIRDGLVLYFPFEEEAAGRDWSGMGNHGAISGATFTREAPVMNVRVELAGALKQVSTLNVAGGFSVGLPAEGSIGLYPYRIYTRTDENSVLNQTASLAVDAVKLPSHTVDLQRETVRVQAAYASDDSPTPDCLVAIGNLNVHAMSDVTGIATFNLAAFDNVPHGCVAHVVNEPHGLKLRPQNQTIQYQKVTVAADGFNLNVRSRNPIVNVAYQPAVGEKKLMFETSGEAVVYVGDLGQPNRIDVDGTLWGDWLYEAATREVTIRGLSSRVVLTWLPPAEELPPTPPPPILPPPKKPEEPQVIMPPPVEVEVPPELTMLGLAVIVGVVVFAFAAGEKARSPEKRWRERSRNVRKGEKWGGRKRRF